MHNAYNAVPAASAQASEVSFFFSGVFVIFLLAWVSSCLLVQFSFGRVKTV